MKKKPTVAIVGAGISGLMAAQTLARDHIPVKVFDKSRSSGGRISTRRESDYTFDHGAQFFTIRDDRFGTFVDQWLKAGVVEEWHPTIAALPRGETLPKRESAVRYVGVPGMSALTKHLARDADIAFNTRVKRVIREGSLWRLVAEDDADLGMYDVVLVATPPAQALPLVRESAVLQNTITEVNLSPCWAVMVVFPEPLPLRFHAAYLTDSPLGWIADNASKPQRPPHAAWVLHAVSSWSARHLDDDPQHVAKELLAAFFSAVRAAPVTPLFLKCHRWRYALVVNPLSDGYVWDEKLRIGVCGDWCYDSRVENAALSGVALAEGLIKEIAG